MMTRILLTGAIALGLLTPAYAQEAGTAAPDQPAHGVNARQHRQAERIRHGARDGNLTPAELDKLRADEAALRAEERVYRESGKDLNGREHRDLERDLNRTSREIRRATHNGHKR